MSRRAKRPVATRDCSRDLPWMRAKVANDDLHFTALDGHQLRLPVALLIGLAKTDCYDSVTECQVCQYGLRKYVQYVVNEDKAELAPPTIVPLSPDELAEIHEIQQKKWRDKGWHQGEL